MRTLRKKFWVYRAGNLEFEFEARRFIPSHMVGFHFGIVAGSNHYLRGKPVNFLIDVDFIIWTFMFTVKKQKSRAPSGPGLS